MHKKNNISLPSHNISQNFLLNQKKYIDQRSKMEDLPNIKPSTKTFENTKRFNRDFYDIEENDVNLINDRWKCVGSPTTFADDIEMNIISSFSSGISLDDLTLSMIKWPGLDDSNISHESKNDDLYNKLNGSVHNYHANSHGNWLSYNNSPNRVNGFSSFSNYIECPYGNIGSRSRSSMDTNVNCYNNDQQVLSNSHNFDSSLFNNNNGFFKSWPLNNNMELTNEVQSPSVTSKSQDSENEIKIASIIESSFDITRNGDSILGSFAPLLSQEDMHRCLLRVIKSLLGASLEFNIVLVYQKVFEKFTLDISKLDIPSVGSFLHHDGFCKPCVFANKKTKTCENGIMCYFCHHVHKDARQRIKAGKRKDSSKKSNKNSTESNSSSKL